MMGFSLVFFGNPDGFQYKKLSSRMDDVLVRQVASQFDKIRAERLELTSDLIIWRAFLYTTKDGRKIIGLSLAKTAYEYSVNRSGGYHGFGILLEQLGCNDYQALVSAMQSIFSYTCQRMLDENGKHIHSSYDILTQDYANNEGMLKEFSTSLQNSLVKYGNKKGLFACLDQTKPYFVYSKNSVPETLEFLLENQSDLLNISFFCINNQDLINALQNVKDLKRVTDILSDLNEEISKGREDAKQENYAALYHELREAKFALVAKKDEFQQKKNEYIFEQQRIPDELKQLEDKRIRLESKKMSLAQSVDQINIDIAHLDAEILGQQQQHDQLIAKIRQFEQQTGKVILQQRTSVRPVLEPSSEKNIEVPRKIPVETGFNDENIKPEVRKLKNSPIIHNTKKPKQPVYSSPKKSNFIFSKIILISTLLIGACALIIYVLYSVFLSNADDQNVNISTSTPEIVVPNEVTPQPSEPDSGFKLVLRKRNINLQGDQWSPTIGIDLTKPATNKVIFNAEINGNPTAVNTDYQPCEVKVGDKECSFKIKENIGVNEYFNLKISRTNDDQFNKSIEAEKKFSSTDVASMPE